MNHVTSAALSAPLGRRGLTQSHVEVTRGGAPHQVPSAVQADTAGAHTPPDAQSVAELPSPPVSKWSHTWT